MRVTTPTRVDLDLADAVRDERGEHDRRRVLDGDDPADALDCGQLGTEPRVHLAEADDLGLQN
jgi:hypothetical protein